VAADPSKKTRGAPLRVAVMIGAASVPRWVAHLLDRIDACPFAEVVGFVREAESTPRPRGRESIRTLRSGLLYGLYSRLDTRRFGTDNDPCEEIDLSDRLGRLPLLEVVPIGPKADERRFDADAISKLEQWDLDVMLSLGFGTVGGGILGCARYGIWAYRHGYPDSGRGGPPLFWEIYEGTRVSESVLLRLTEEPGAGQVIYRSFSAIDPISLQRSRARTYWNSAEFVVRKLRDVHRDGELPGHPASPEIDDIPTNRQMLRFGLSLTAQLAWRRARRALAREQWFLAYRRRATGLPTAETFRAATVMAPPSDRFYADPCLVDWQGSTYLFFEDFRFAEGRGVVSCCELTPDGRPTPPEVVLERPYHLSYPFVFFVGEDAYMLPETAASGAIELYKAPSFPSDWELEATLVSHVRAVDPTLIEHDGRYWLFANVAVEGASTNDELFLFSAQDLRGPWEPHRQNPVVSDVRRARPAGRPFIDEGGSLIRPSQDCSGIYGSAVVFNRIEELSEADYRETPVGRLEPGWQRRNLGTHTYTCSAEWEAVDGRSWVRARAGYGGPLRA
jgi:hypothetical protein